MSFKKNFSVITSSSSVTTHSGAIFLAKVVIISSLLVELSVASSIGGSSSASAGGGSSSGGLDTIIAGGGTSSSGGSSSIAGSSNYYLGTGTEVWIRNLDTQLLRLGSRLDQLMIRMDHLDSRVGRVQSQGHLRFDSIETSMQTTRQRLDVWSNQLSIFEDQLTRKWKNMESRFDSLVSTLDSKLDTKFNLIQRDNRRHNEFISSSFNSVIISQEKLNERVVNSLSEMNSTVVETRAIVSNQTDSLLSRVSEECYLRNNSLTDILTTYLGNFSRICPHNPIQQQQQNNNHHLHHHHNRNSNLVGYEQLLPSSSSSTSQHYYNPNSYGQQANSTQVHLITSKVTNMFDELVKRSQNLEAIVKDTFTMSNVTRREVQDGFRLVIPAVNQITEGNNGGARSISSNGGVSSAEVMSALVVEGLASVESISTNVARRMTELSRTIDERFEMVSMTLNGFLESCLRIQEKAPLIEDSIGEILWKILDSVDNSTRNAKETITQIQVQLLKEQQQFLDHYQRNSHHQKRNNSSCSDNLIMASLQRGLVNQQQQSRYASSQGHNVNQAASSSGSGGEAGALRNRSYAPISSWGLPPRGGEDYEPLETGDTDQENVVGGLPGFGGEEDDEHNNGDNDDNIDGDSGEDESEEPLKVGRSKLVFNTGSRNHQHHQRHHHRQPVKSNVNRNVNPSASLGELYPIPNPSSGTSQSEGAIASISGTNIRSPQSSMTLNSQHNVNDNVNLASSSTHGLSSSSSALLGVRETTTSDNNNGMGVVSSSAHVSGNSNNHNHNGGVSHSSSVHLNVDNLSEDEKKLYWETLLSPHTSQRGSVPE